MTTSPDPSSTARPQFVLETHLRYLDDLSRQGVNMGTVWLRFADKFRLDKNLAQRIIAYWRTTK